MLLLINFNAGDQIQSFVNMKGKCATTQDTLGFYSAYLDNVYM